MRDALAHLGTIKLTGPEGIGLAVDLREADEGAIAGDLSELFLQLGAAAASKGSGVVFLLDEVQFINEIEYRSLISALHPCDSEEHANHRRSRRPASDSAIDRRGALICRALVYLPGYRQPLREGRASSHRRAGSPAAG
jgi:hypothetical protein